MSKTPLASSRLHDLLVVVLPIKLINSKDEGLPGGFLFPSKIALCSYTGSQSFSQFVSCLIYILRLSVSNNFIPFGSRSVAYN